MQDYLGSRPQLERGALGSVAIIGVKMKQLAIWFCGNRSMEKECRRTVSHICRSAGVLLVGCLTSQQHASVSQGRICSDNFTCCHTEIEVADQTFYLTQSQYTDTGPTSPSADPITPGAWQGSHWSANFEVTGMTRPRKIPAQAGFEPWIFRSRGGRLSH